MRWPSWMPAGTSTSSVRDSETRPAPRHCLARVLDDLPAPATVRARVGADELAEDAPRHLVQATAPFAARTGQRLGAGLDAVAAADLAGDRHLERHLDLRPACRSDELDLDLGSDVCAALLRGAARSAAEDVVAEECGEEIAEAAHVEVGRCEAARAEARMAVAVVERSPFRAGEHFVRLRHLTEPDLRLRLAGDVGMQFAGEPAERLLDRGVVGVASDAEQLVVVAVGAHLSSA